MNTYTLNLQPILKLDDEQFLQLSQANPDLKFERSQQGNLIIMLPTGGETGNRNAELIGEFIIWNRRKKLGQVFDSSTGFKLPNGAIRSPDVAWVKQKRWDHLSTEEKRKFPTLAPDFVLELRSETDSLAEIQAKLREYIENGVRLGSHCSLNFSRVEGEKELKDLLPKELSQTSNLTLTRRQVVSRINQLWNVH